MRRRAVVRPIDVRVAGIADLGAFLISHVGVFEISGVAIEKCEVRSGGVARREMVERAARGAQIVEGIRAVKRRFAGIGPHVGEKDECRRMQYRRGLEWRTGGNQAVGAFEIDAITKCHAIQRVHFRGKESGGGTIENAAAIHEIGRVGRVLPKRILRDIRRQGVEPRAVSVTAGGKTGEISPMDIVLIVTAGGAGRAVGDAEIGKDLIVVIQIHVKREAPLPEIAEAGDAIGLFLRLGQRGQKHRRQNRDDGDHHEQFDQRKSALRISLHAMMLAERFFVRFRQVAIY